MITAREAKMALKDSIKSDEYYMRMIECLNEGIYTAIEKHMNHVTLNIKDPRLTNDMITSLENYYENLGYDFECSCSSIIHMLSRTKTIRIEW